MTEPRIIATIDARHSDTFNDYDGLTEQLRLWLDERGISHAMLEELAGLSKGHAGKILGQAQIKKFSTFSLFAVANTLALRFRIEEDPEMAEQMRQHWEYCEVKQRRSGNMAQPVGKKTMNRLMPAVAREMGRRGGKSVCLLSAKQAARSKGGKARKRNMTRLQRTAVARKAAVVRWAKRNAHRDILILGGDQKANVHSMPR